MKTNTMMLVLASALGLGAKAAVDLSAIQFFAMGDTVVENDLNGQTIASATLPKGAKMVLTNGTVTTLAANGAEVEVSTGTTVGTATGTTTDEAAAKVIVAAEATSVSTLTLEGTDTTGVVANTKKPETINAVVGDVGETETTYYTDWNKVVGADSVVASGKKLEIQKSYTSGQAKLASVNDTVTIDASAQAYAASDVTTIENAKVITQGETVNNTTTYIAKWDMEKATIASVGNQTYKGTAYNELTPEVTHPGVQGALASGTDFDFSYGANTTVAQNGTITATGKGNFTGTKSIDFDIVAKELTVTANAKPLTYGDAPANDGVTYSGFVDGEDESVLGGELAYDYTYVQFGDIGTYKITPSGLSADNYFFKYVEGDQVVGARTASLTWNGSTWVYDRDSHLPTVEVGNLVNGDAIAATVGTAQTNVGDYTATATALTGEKAGNYVLPSNVEQAFSITKRPITVNVAGVNQTKTYNGKNQSVTAGYTLSCDDAKYLAEEIVRADTTTEAVNAGEYYFGLAANQFSCNNANIEATFNVTGDGKLKIEPLEAELSWGSTEFVYSGYNQKPTCTVANLQTSDASVRDTCEVTVTGEQKVPGEGYTATAASLANSNYVLPAATTTTFAIDGTVAGEAEVILASDGVKVAIPAGATLEVAADQSATITTGTVTVGVASTGLTAEVAGATQIAANGGLTAGAGASSAVYLYGNQEDVNKIAAASAVEGGLMLTGDTLKIKAVAAE